mgnify:CR=1 FL=1
MASKRNPAEDTALSSNNGAGEHLSSARQHLLQAAREAAAGVSEAGNAASSAFSSGIAAARPELGAAGSEVREARDAAARQLQQQWGQLRGRTEGFVREHPLAALGIAAAGGYLLSRFLRR